MPEQEIRKLITPSTDATLATCMPRLDLLLRMLAAVAVEDTRQDAAASARLLAPMAALALPWSPNVVSVLEAYADDLAENVRPGSGLRAMLLRFLLLDDYSSRAARAVVSATAGEGFGSASHSASFVRAASSLLTLAAGPHGRSGDPRVANAVRALVTEMVERLGALGGAVVCTVKGSRTAEDGRTRLTLVPIDAPLSEALPGIGSWPTPPDLDELMLVGAPLPQPIRLRPFVSHDGQSIRFLASTPRRPDPTYVTLDPSARPQPAPLEEIVPFLTPEPLTLPQWRSLLKQELERIGQRNVAVGTSMIGSLTDSDVGEGSLLGDRFELGQELSRGTVGAVFQGREADTGEPAIIKVMVTSPTASADAIDLARESFVREAEVLQRVQHPGIPRLLFDGSHGKPPFLAIEAFPSESLRDVLTRGRLAVPYARQIMVQLADIVGALHAEGIVHRDLKPENVLVGRDERLLLIDYGLAITRAAQGVIPSDVGGTLPYMAPESMGAGLVSPATDVFALGVMLYECLAHKPLFGGATRREMADAIRAGKRAPASGLPAPARSLYAVVAACTEPRAERRPRDGRQVRDLIASAEDAADGGRASGLLSRIFRRRT